MPCSLVCAEWVLLRGCSRRAAAFLLLHPRVLPECSSAPGRSGVFCPTVPQ